MLKVHEINVYRGDIHILKSVSLAAHEGKITALLGSNGAGKTTLLMAITGLLKPRTGSIWVNGFAIDKRPVHKIVEMGVSMVPEGRRLFPGMSILENLELGAFTRKARETKDQMIEEVFEIFSHSQNQVYSDGRHFKRRGTANAGHCQGIDVPSKSSAYR